MTDYSAEYFAEARENAVLHTELKTVLDLVFDSIETESYINPFGIMSYLKAVYPNRWEKKMRKLYAQDDESDIDT